MATAAHRVDAGRAARGRGLHDPDGRTVDCLQADATRCLGITGFLRAAALADAHGLDLSGHTAPSLHLHAGLAAPRLRHLEWFHDHEARPSSWTPAEPRG